ncbi:hypothetical protein BX070DRAFT_249966 [Coemansia spiralis]|nr:hypothetical protein BX070DRAFT_249966 [Coemansia spiralis]
MDEAPQSSRPTVAGKSAPSAEHVRARDGKPPPAKRTQQQLEQQHQQPKQHELSNKRHFSPTSSSKARRVGSKPNINSDYNSSNHKHMLASATDIGAGHHQRHRQLTQTSKQASTASALAGIAPNTSRDSDSESDSDDHDGFVKIDRWNSSHEPHSAVSFKPTILRSHSPADSLKSHTAPMPALAAKPSKLMDRVRNSLKAAVVSNAASSAASNDGDDGLDSPTDGREEPLYLDPSANVDTVTGYCTHGAKVGDGAISLTTCNSSDSDDTDSCSDEDISNVLDETEIQLIEAMEDTQISDAKNKRSINALQKHSVSPTQAAKTSTVAAATDLSANASHSAPIVGSPRKSLMLTGLSEGQGSFTMGYVDSLRERFSASKMLSNSTNASIATFHENLSNDCASEEYGGPKNNKRSASILAYTNTATSSKVPQTKTTSSTRSATANTSDAGSNPGPVPKRSNSKPQATYQGRPKTILKVHSTQSASNSDQKQKNRDEASNSIDACLFEPKDIEHPRPTSVPLDSVEFVAPGVTKQTAMSLLQRVLDIDGPVIQQKMVEFLLIDGVIASLIGFITHCRGSIYSPSSETTTQTAPCSPSVSYHQNTSVNSNANGHQTADSTPVAAEGTEVPFSEATKTAAGGHGQSQPIHEYNAAKNTNKDLPISVLQEFDLRNRHRERLQRQRNRSSGLTEDDLRRAYNATQMLCSRDNHARKVLEAKLSVIIPSLMAVFHKDSLGSFHHVCMLLEHCFTISPLKTTRLLLYQQNPPSRWWSFSESVAKGYAPICDIFPYLSEPCVQRFFLKAEFGVWTGLLMVYLNLSPNDAVVVSDELHRIGLGSVAGALGKPEDKSSGQAQNQQRSKSMQLVRNRFQQLNRGGFLNTILELIEDPDPHISESVADFISYMINDFSTFYGFNILFKPMYDSELPVRRLAQLIVNSPSQRLSPQAKAATRVLHALLAKTSCQYGLRTREAQGIRDPEMRPRGSHVLLQVGQAARSALESFLPGLLATVTGQHKNSDLTSHSAYNRRASVESLQLPEYDESDSDLDTDDTETETSNSNSDNEESCGDGHICDSNTQRLLFEQGIAEGLTASGEDSNNNSDNESSDGEHGSNVNVADLRSSAAALLHAAYPDSIGSGSISSSLSPSSTLSASPMAIASSTPDDTYIREGLDSEEMGLLVSLPKPDTDRLNLLKICVEVLRESDDIDEVVGWIDLRVWRALGSWFLNHPHNNLLHLSVYQLMTIIALEAVRLRKAHRRLYSGLHARTMHAESLKMFSTSHHLRHHRQHNSSSFSKPARAIDSRASASTSDISNYLSAHTHQLDDSSSSDEHEPEPQPQRVAQHKAHRRRILAERIRHEEASNCDNILTYLIEQNQWVDKLIRRTASANFDGAHGYIALILNTLRLAVQVDRRRCPSDTGSVVHNIKDKGLRKHGDCPSFSYSSSTTAKQRQSCKQSQVDDDSDDGSSSFSGDVNALESIELGAADKDASVNENSLKTLSEFSDSEASEDKDILPDLAYHDPETRSRLGEYPLYRLQRWEISLLYSPSFRSHLRCLRGQAEKMAKELDEFKLCDQSRTEITGSSGANRRPVPFFSPQKVKPPVLFDNAEIKKKQLQINVGLLLGNNGRRSSNSSSSVSGSSSSSQEGRQTAFGDEEIIASSNIDEFGVDINSLFARMLGFTEDLIEQPIYSNSSKAINQLYDGSDSINYAAINEGDKAPESNDAKMEKRAAACVKKSNTSSSGSHGKQSSLRRKKSKPSPGLPLASSPSVTELFEDMSHVDAADAAEAICSALANESNANNTSIATVSAKYAQQGGTTTTTRGRKKPSSVSGSVRRRRARLHNKASNSSLNTSSSSSLATSQQQAPLDLKLALSASKSGSHKSTATEEDYAELESQSPSLTMSDGNEVVDEIANDCSSTISATGLTSSIQSLDLIEQ